MFKQWILRVCVLGVGIVANLAYVYADETFYLDQQQLNNARTEIVNEGKQAINTMPQAQHELSLIKLESSAVLSESQLAEANRAFKYRKSLATKLPNGETYRLYSESIVSEAKAYTASNQALYINQTIANYNQLIKNAQVQIGANRLLIFVSSSMPKKSLVNLMQQGSSIGTVIVIRGLINGSYINTYKYFYKLKGDVQVGIMINPALFQALDVQAVPTFAVYKSQQDILKTTCKVAPEYAKISGEMTVHYALEQLSHSNNADLANLASNQLEILDNGSFYKVK